MPGDLRKISLLAIVLLVLLRISIGWHLMYEGLWKLSTQQTSTPWTAAGYLKNSTGPLRPMFRAMTGDPDDLNWLNYDKMSQKWQAWRQQFVTHYRLSEDQKESFDLQMDGPETYSARLDALPPGFELAKVDGVNKEAIWYDAESKALVVSGKLHLLPVEHDRLVAAVKKIYEANPEAESACNKFTAALARVYKASTKLSNNEQLVALLKGDPERVGVIIQVKGAAKADDGEQTPVLVQVGEVQYYRELIDRFNRNYAKARTKSEWDHVEKQWKDLQDLRRKLVSPVQGLEKEMEAEAEGLLTTEQLSAGPVPEPADPVRQIDWRTMWGLTIFGLLLMVGLFTRLSALGGAALLSLFYMAMPPWPGVQEIPSIEHNLFVNKVFVEMLALLAIAAMPSGKWFGIDAAISALLTRRPKR